MPSTERLAIVSVPGVAPDFIDPAKVTDEGFPDFRLDGSFIDEPSGVADMLDGVAIPAEQGQPDETGKAASGRLAIPGELHFVFPHLVAID